ncbi:hypothetical protein FF1_042833 [Malus domestica]
MAQVVFDRDPPVTNHSDNPNKPNFGISSCILPSRIVRAAPYTHPKRKRKKNSGYRLMLEIVAEPINVRSMVHYEGAGKLNEVKTPSVTDSASATTNVKPPKATSSYFKVFSDPSSSWPPAPGLAFLLPHNTHPPSPRSCLPRTSPLSPSPKPSALLPPLRSTSCVSSWSIRGNFMVAAKACDVWHGV